MIVSHIRVCVYVFTSSGLIIKIFNKLRSWTYVKYVMLTLQRRNDEYSNMIMECADGNNSIAV